MGRYNSVSTTTITTGATTFYAPSSGLVTSLTGTAPYTVTLSNPVLYIGQSQSFYNATGGTVTLTTPSGVFNGLADGIGIGTASITIPANAFYTVSSDGTNYLLNNNSGGATKIASNIASSSYTSGSLVITGGVGISGDTYNNGRIISNDGTDASNGTSDSSIKTSGGIAAAKSIWSSAAIGTTSTGYIKPASGTTAQQPGSAVAGWTRYNTTNNYLEVYNGTSWVPAGGFRNVDITSSVSVEAWQLLWIASPGAALTLTLPSSPNKGDTIRFVDVAKNFATYNLTIARNGQPIQGDAANMTIATNGAAFDLIYYNATYGWRIFSI